MSSTVIEPNPIFSAEHRHQQRTAVYTRLPASQIALIILFGFYALLFLAIALEETVAALLNISTIRLQEQFRQIVDTTTPISGVLLFVVQSIAIAQALQIASSTIAREKEGRTWELITLTGIDAHRIIRGKWRATLASASTIHRPLLIWRAMLMTIQCTILLQVESLPSPFFLIIFLAPVVIVVYTIVGTATAAAIGILASTLNRQEGSAYRTAMLLHLIYVVSSLVVLFTVFLSREDLVSNLAFVILAPFDGGITSLFHVINIRATGLTLGMLIVSLTVYAVFNGLVIQVLLRFAEQIAVFQRVSSKE